MADYKQFSFSDKIKIDSDYNIIEKEYIPQLNDLPDLYNNIQTAFNDKDGKSLIRSMEKLKLYISTFSNFSQKEFQDFLFPILIQICKISDNDELVLYGFEYISFIIKNHINLIPLLAETNFFDFCFVFLFVQNQKKLIIYWTLENIANFILLRIENRNYSIERFQVSYIINNFILNEKLISEEEDPFDIQVQALKILQCYTQYPIDGGNAQQIFNICNYILNADPIYTSLFEKSMWIIINLIQNNLEFQKILLNFPEADLESFRGKIEYFVYDSEPELIIPALNILFFFLSHNIPLSDSFYNQIFLDTLCHRNAEVCDIAFKCLSKILDKQMENAINRLTSGDFLNKLQSILDDSPYNIKLRAANIACILLENCVTKISKPIFQNGYVHLYFTILQLEENELTLRVLISLYNIYERYNALFCYKNQNEDSIFQDLIESPIDEISNIAKDFVNKFLRPQEIFNENQDNDNHIKYPRKRNIRKKNIDPPPLRSKNPIRMWNPNKSITNNNNNTFDEITSMTQCYYQYDSNEQDDDI